MPVFSRSSELGLVLLFTYTARLYRVKASSSVWESRFALPRIARAAARDSGEPKGKSAGLIFVAPSRLRLSFPLNDLADILPSITVVRRCACRCLEPIGKGASFRIGFQLKAGHSME